MAINFKKIDTFAPPKEGLSIDPEQPPRFRAGRLRIDSFARDNIIVFAGNSASNFLNLLFQLLIAYKLAPVDFAAFNCLLAIYMIVSSPLTTLQSAVARYCAQFSSLGQTHKIGLLLTGLLKKSLILAGLTFLAVLLFSRQMLSTFKIYSPASGYILAVLLAIAWFLPILSGGLQGLQYFGWFSISAVAAGVFKLLAAIIFLILGYKIAGALGALLLGGITGIIISYLPLHKTIVGHYEKQGISYKEFLVYLLPLFLASFLLSIMATFDMILVKYYFSPQDSGFYALAQMIGKIFLFLPSAISLVMFVKVSGLEAKNMDTLDTLKRSLSYALTLCLCAVVSYNLFPAFFLKILTGKAYEESISLGRLFSISMSFCTLSTILCSYFLSLKKFLFLKYLFFFAVLQSLLIILIHNSLVSVQVIMCVNSAVLFFLLLKLAYVKKDTSGLIIGKCCL